MTRPRWTAEEDARLLLLREQGHTFDAIGDAMRRHRSAVHKRWQRLQTGKPRPRKPAHLAEPGKATIVGVIGDTHLPFCHERYLDFICETFERWHVNRVVHIGDFWDWHACSFWSHDPDGLSPGREYETALEDSQKWYAAFPSVTIIQGNHDKLPSRKLEAAGLPRRLLRKNHMDLPDAWQFVESEVVDDVLYTHGTGGGNGVNGPRLMALKRGMSCVIGHFHQSAGVSCMPRRDDAQIFGMGVGCGIHRHAYSFAYAKDQGSMALGCGVVIEGREAHYIPMRPR